MPLADQGARVRPADIERWLDELGLRPDARSDREGVTSWDLRLDGRRRFDVPITLILDPSLALIVWVHFAPPIGDAFRKSYRRLLRWNDEFPFAKFSLAEDERPILTVELPTATAGRDDLGLALARSLAIADRLLEESAGWLWIGGRIPDTSGRVSRGAPLLDRYHDALGELDELDEAPAGADVPPLAAAGADR
ncbi:MAG TPA: YbjN domain-containing protein [Candidatus Limnocylindrales bacterium]|nr:YbjN domain-containing protein [Candidatus Limnocylindrales bacterium]